MPNSVRKPPTNFTIDCILSKSDSVIGDHHKSPPINHPMNKVLDNPWIPKCPLALTFNPSSHRKLNFSPTTPNGLNLFNQPNIAPYADTFFKATQHFTSVRNHFYPAASSDGVNSDDNSSSLPKSIVYENNTSCDNEILRNSLSLTGLLDASKASSIFKCSTCSKTFENSDILDVSANEKFSPKKLFLDLKSFLFEEFVKKIDKFFLDLSLFGIIVILLIGHWLSVKFAKSQRIELSFSIFRKNWNSFKKCLKS